MSGRKQQEQLIRTLTGNGWKELPRGRGAHRRLVHLRTGKKLFMATTPSADPRVQKNVIAHARRIENGLA